jgi:hypothetical protein
LTSRADTDWSALPGADIGARLAGADLQFQGRSLRRPRTALIHIKDEAGDGMMMNGSPFWSCAMVRTRFIDAIRTQAKRLAAFAVISFVFAIAALPALAQQQTTPNLPAAPKRDRGPAGSSRQDERT